MSDTYTWPQRCPDLVQDVSLKRARIDGENNTSTIRVSGTFSESTTDITPITEALGATTDTSNDPTLIGLTKSNNISIIRMDNTTTHIGSVLGGVQTNTQNTATALGSKTDTAWSGSGDGSVIAILKSIYTKLQ